MNGFCLKVKTVEAEYVYHAPESYTIDQAKRTAIDRARIQAIADEFGTTVSQTNISNMSTSTIDFQTIGLSEVKGEWLEDIEEPTVEAIFENGQFIITVHVKGKARELRSMRSDCKVRILRNGKDDNYESDQFLNLDQFYISFQSASSGVIAVYLLDNSGLVSCLLPYESQDEPNFAVKANRRYLLFDPASGDDSTEEYYFTCGPDSEMNQIYVVFSPNKFTKAVDYKNVANEGEILPRQLSAGDFQKWLAKSRQLDPEMQVIIRAITITNQN